MIVYTYIDGGVRAERRGGETSLSLSIYMCVYLLGADRHGVEEGGLGPQLVEVCVLHRGPALAVHRGGCVGHRRTLACWTRGGVSEGRRGWIGERSVEDMCVGCVEGLKKGVLG